MAVSVKTTAQAPTAPTTEDTKSKVEPEITPAQETAPVEEKPVEAPAEAVPTEEKIEEKVETPVVDTPKIPDPEVKKPDAKVEPVMVSKEIQILRELIERHKVLTSEVIPDTTKCRANFAEILRHAVFFQEIPQALEEVLQFLKSFGKTLAHPTNALVGTLGFGKAQQKKVQIAYSMLYELASGRKPELDLELAQKVLGGSGLVTFVQQKIR